VRASILHKALCRRFCSTLSPVPAWGRSIKYIIVSDVCIHYHPFRQTLPPRQGPLSPFPQHNILSASLGSFYQVHHCVRSFHPLRYFCILSVRPSRLDKALCRRSRSTTSSVPAWGRFTNYIIVSSLSILYATFESFPSDPPVYTSPLSPFL
jgi:hypothetical protein